MSRRSDSSQYSRIRLAATVSCVLGVALVTLSDSYFSLNAPAAQSSSSVSFVGDLLAICGALVYCISYLCQERLCVRHSKVARNVTGGAACGDLR